MSCSCDGEDYAQALRDAERDLFYTAEEQCAGIRQHDALKLASVRYVRALIADKVSASFLRVLAGPILQLLDALETELEQ